MQREIQYWPDQGCDACPVALSKRFPRRAAVRSSVQFASLFSRLN